MPIIDCELVSFGLWRTGTNPCMLINKWYRLKFEDISYKRTYHAIICNNHGDIIWRSSIIPVTVSQQGKCNLNNSEQKFITYFSFCDKAYIKFRSCRFSSLAQLLR